VPRHIVCLTYDFDTQSGFIARGMTTPTPLSRGEFGLVGAQRILALLKSFGLRATWFVPGFTIESHPHACEAVVRDGHEVGHHSWAHIPPAQQKREEEEADLVRANEAIARLTGRKARGYRSPAWDLSESTIDLLLAHGFLYDSSLMGADYWPYRARRGDRVELGKPYGFGEETALIEFVRTATAVLPGLQSARTVMENWLDEFRYMQKTVDWGVLTYTMHPYVIGRGYRMLAFEELVKSLLSAGAVFMTMEDAAKEAQERMFAS
jgi:peptidoglycan-N-acetylglucosamine deacetylase